MITASSHSSYVGVGTENQSMKVNGNVASNILDSDDDADEYHDSFSNIDDDLTYPISSHRDDRVPLIPAEFSTVPEALHNFITVFESRYGGLHPPFARVPLQNAIRDAFEQQGHPIMERRPLAVYLHNDMSVACNIFAQEVICSDLVTSLLKEQFVTWPWDMTQHDNRQKLFEWLDMLNLHDLRSMLERMDPARYPLLVVLIRDKGVMQVADISWGNYSKEQVVEKLVNGLDMHQRIKLTEAAEERERIERENVRREQAEEYQRSLAADKAKQEEQERIRNEQR
ncbi:hypothetical protein AB6A40_010825 [Gnathostoma spinigerum]|uniref:UAS domain-containing protein n=1 Tax=Gnathostoma spinigerum TaxID=75299 RepID=A0ABD6F1X0_9BILA